MSASASGGPSISTAAGCKASSAAIRLAAEPGPWCRLPKRGTRSSMALHHGADRGVQIGPVLALPHHVLEILLQGDGVLHRVLHHRADEVGGEARGIDLAVAEMAGLGPGANADRDRLGGRERAGDGLELHLAVQRLPVAQLAEQ